ncbi:hypothetical protein J8N05_15245 [Streptomyces sp. BH-SS-21]|uniref:Uncharacterized protein n=1 Tax=Streptomyces liliiviolaceus TaxID=2823109 RepID=A0A940XSW2_9ACTN|nr:hypothetical protein [Streptomyces liliiviolaceus]MBQ0849556.1 hypothetical protein [Streptomyces liliiviolaceus]
MEIESSEFLERKKVELGDGEPRRELEKLCQERRIECSWIWHESLGLRFRVGFPNGREKRWQIVTPADAKDLLLADFPVFTYLGDFDAVLFNSSQTVEAAIRSDISYQAFFDLPGVRKIEPPQPELPGLEDDVDEESRFGSRIQINDAWVLDFSPTPDRPDLRVQIGSASRNFSAVSDRKRRRLTARDRPPLPGGLGRFPTLRISGMQVTRHDDALDLLKRISGAIFFELDLQYGVAASIIPSFASELARRKGRVQREKNQQLPRNPQNQYPEKPLSLYRYGRSSGIPLLEYLAYYQVLEYFFPSFSHRDTLARLRNELLDPRFRADDDSNLVRIIGLTAGTGKAFGSERDQLRSTIAGCVTEGHLRDFIASDDILHEHFSGKQKIKDVTHLNLADTRNDFLTAVANRVYDIRCRIVHTKDDGGGAADLLLPFTKEAEDLGPDIELVKYLAQKVLIAGASHLRL